MKLTNNLSIDAQMSVDIDQGFSAFQLREIRSGLEQGFDVSIYAKKTHGYRLMQLALLLLNAHINIDYCLENDRLNVNLLLERYRQCVWEEKIKLLSTIELVLILRYAYTD